MVVTPTDAHFIRTGEGYRIGRACTTRQERDRFEEDCGTEDWDGRENGRTISWGGRGCPNSREHGATLFRNAARPSRSCRSASKHRFARSPRFLPPTLSLAPLTGWEGRWEGGGEGGGRGEWGGSSSLFFFLELSVDRPSTTASREKERARSKKRVSRKKETRESILRAYSYKALKRQTANQSLFPANVPKGSFDEGRSSYQQPPYPSVFRSTVDPRNDNPDEVEVRDGEGKSALITYGKGNSFLSPISTYSSLSVQFFGGSSQPGSLLNPQYDSGESSSPSFLLLSLSFPHSPPQWREGTPPSRHLDDCGERENRVTKKIN